MTRHITHVEECRTALKGVLASTCFARSTRQRRLLEHLVTRLLEGQVLSLKESVLAIEFFGRTADKFDPVKDTAVRVEARRLRQRLSLYYAKEGARDAWEIRIPVGRYVPTFTRRGLAHRVGVTRRARDLVERGDHFLRSGEFRPALERFEEALRESADYAQAHLGVARVCVNLSMGGLDRPEPLVAQGLAALERTIELEPALAEAAALRGLLLHRFRHDWQMARRDLVRAVELAPHHARVRALYGFQLIFARLYETAECELRIARELDPQNPTFRLHMVWLRIAQRRWHDAAAECEALLDVAPGNPWVVLSRADVALYSGQHERAIALFQEARSLRPGHADCEIGEACALFAMGRHAEAERAIKRGHAGPHLPSPFALAEAMACALRYDDALALLRESAATRHPLFVVGTVSPLFEPLYGVPAFRDLYRSSLSDA